MHSQIVQYDIKSRTLSRVWFNSTNQVQHVSIKCFFTPPNKATAPHSGEIR